MTKLGDGLGDGVGDGRSGSVGEGRSGSVGDDWGSNMLDHGHGLADGINKPVLVEILGESLQSIGSVALGGGHEVSDSGGQRTGWQTGVDVAGAGQADASQGEDGNLRRNISET